MQPDKTDPLQSAFKEPNLGVKVFFFAAVIAAVGLIAWTKWKEQPAVTDDPKGAPVAMRGEATGASADPRIAELTAENEKLRAQLQAREEPNQGGAKTLGEWNKLVSQIVVKLERVIRESDRFQTARRDGDLETEESRLVGLAREQESAARSIASDLKSLNFPRAEKLDSLIQDFTTQYAHFTTYRRLSWQSLLLLGSTSQEVQEKANKYQSEFYSTLREIRSIVKSD